MELREGYKQTDVGVIPNVWRVIVFGELTDKIIGGGTPSRTNPLFWGNEIPWVTVKDFSTFNPAQTQEYITKEGLKKSASHLIPKGIIITSTRMALGKAAIYDVDVSINQDLKAIFPSKAVITKFFYYWFQYNSKKIEDLGSGSTVMGLSLPDLKKIKIPLPPLPEQTAIAEVLSDTDNLIQALEKQIAKKRNIKQGALQKLLQPKEGWENRPIKNLATISTGAKNTQDKIDDGAYPFFVRSQNIEKINTYSFDGEAILIAGDGVGTGKVMHYYIGKFDFHQRVYKLSDFQDIICGLYFFLFFKSNFYNRMMQMTAKSSVDSIRREMISEMIISFPPPEEQSRIATILSDMDAELNNLESKLEKYKLLKLGMMQNLLTGKIRLNKS